MQPLDAITNIDEKTIKSYFSIYGNTECGPLCQVLYEWNKNKKTLFRALGKNLSVSKMITIPKSDNLIDAELESIFHPYIIWYNHDVISIKEHPDRVQEITNNEFLTNVLIFWVKKNYCLTDLRILSSLFMHKNFRKGYIISNVSDEPYHCQGFNCTIKNGMKTIRTIQKVLKSCGYPNMDLFEKWRNQVSLIQISNEIKAKLVISIHPIDFVSMSENTCNWRSCMGWSNNGCYSAGTLEMMNSNIAAVAYLESFSPFNLHLSETNEIYSVPNKSWRSLVFIHKDIILVGKQYPYHNAELTKIVLKFLKELVKKNLNWNYSFSYQRYHDMDNIDGNFYVRDFFDINYDKKKKHHCIFFYTNGMYNDIIESHYPHYYCCRNYVSKSKKICLSGPATCICCGKRIYENPRYDICSYDDLGQQKVCFECQKKYCKVCHKYYYTPKYYTHFGIFCSDKCAEEIIVLPKFKRPTICTKDDLQFSYRSRIVIFSDKDISYKERQNICDDFNKNAEKDGINTWIQNCLANPAYNFRIYKIPAKLCDWSYANISNMECTDYRASASGQYYLNIFNLDCNGHFKYKEKIVQQLSEKISLLEYLKEGKN